MSNLTLQQQKQEELRPVRNQITRAQEIPLPAPVATRPPVASMQPNQLPAGGMWNPEMGIKFGGPPSGQPTPQGGPKAGQWDPNSGVRFG
jgi:programmed cell death 6-interacting protein